MQKRSRNSQYFGVKCGFTLVEIMIVVLIIGILLAIAIPNFVAARETSRAKSCVANLYQINSAKMQCIMDNKLSATDTTSTFFLDGTTPTAPGVNGKYQLVAGAGSVNYIRQMPVCPSGGLYTPNTAAVPPTCSITGVMGSGYALGERWYHGY